MSGRGHERDARAMQRGFERAAAAYDQFAVLQAEVRSRLLARLEYVRLVPELCVDLGSATGQAAGALAQIYPQGQVLAVDRSQAMLATGRDASATSAVPVRADAARLPLPDASVDLVFSNLLLHCYDDPDSLFAEVRRVLKPGGLFNFTSFGPDTLRELRRAWATADDAVHVNRFIDMHELGDGLVRAGLVEPVMDIDYVTLTYATVDDLVRDLRALGETNHNAGRPAGLTGRTRWQRMVAGYEAQRHDGRLPATCEIVFGQAWGRVGTYRPRGLPGEVLVPVDSIGRR